MSDIWLDIGNHRVCLVYSLWDSILPLTSGNSNIMDQNIVDDKVSMQETETGILCFIGRRWLSG